MADRQHGWLFSCCTPNPAEGPQDGEIVPPTTPCSIRAAEDADLYNVSPTDERAVSKDSKLAQLVKAVSDVSTDVPSQRPSRNCSLLTDNTNNTELADKDAKNRPVCLLPTVKSAANMMLPTKSSPCRSTKSRVTIGSASQADGTPVVRKRDAFRNMGRRMTAKMTKRFTSMGIYRKQSTLQTASRKLPSPFVPKTAPLSSHHLDQVPLANVRGALHRTNKCPMIRFLGEVAGCYDFVSTEWEDCSQFPGSQVRKCCYTAPVPPDVPSFARRLLNVPDKISSSTVWRLRQDGQELTLLQHSYTRDVLYGDRFKVQNAIVFHEDEDGEGVTMDQWMEIVWEKPLPWTHGVVRHFIEAKARSDALAFSGDLVRCIEEAVDTLPPGWDSQETHEGAVGTDTPKRDYEQDSCP